MLNIFCSCIFLASELVFQLIEADEDKKSPGVLQLQITVLLTAGAAQWVRVGICAAPHNHYRPRHAVYPLHKMDE